ncbi:MAG: hypothetical protein Q4F11_09370 [Eubacteriales bacterium]|nr:hypothetical protein [Eubacteriales bacterium]
MKKFRNIPAIFTLAAGFTVCVVMIMNEYSLKDFLWILVCVMAGFYLVGIIVKTILYKIYKKEEEKREAEKKLEDEEASKEAEQNDEEAAQQ